MSMWAVRTPIPPRPGIPLNHEPKKPPRRPFSVTVSAASQPPQNEALTSDDIGGLGQTLLTAVNTPVPKQEKQMSGSDVLWALQRAASQKNKSSSGKRRKKKRELSSAGGHREEDGVDYSNVRPLRIKSEWGARLDELEQRLQELSDTTT